MDALAAARDALAKGKRAAVVTVTGLEGAPPSREGLAFALIEGGQTFGTLGCDGFDRAAETDAARALATSFLLDTTYDWDEGSRIRVNVRPLRPGEHGVVPRVGAQQLVAEHLRGLRPP